MNPRGRDFIIGLTVIAGLLGVAILLMKFGEFHLGRHAAYRVMLHLDQSSGVSTASTVTLNGVKVGAIETIVASPDPRDGVTLTLLVDEPNRIPKDAAITLERGLVGEATLAIRTRPREEGKPEPGFLQPGETLAATAVSMFDEIGSMIDRRLAPFTSAAKAFEDFSRTWAEVGERSKDLLASRTSAQVDAGATANLASVIDRFDKATKSAQGWLGDDTLKSDVRSAAGRFQQVLDQAAGAFKSLDSAAQTVSGQADRVGNEVAGMSREIATAAHSLGEAIAQMQSLLAGINNGEGTLGQLAKNPDLYRSLNDAAVRLEKALAEAQLLLEKYRTEGIPLKF